ncbi:MAG: chromate efflux transporter [Candidatus Latescibacterota bacterium]|nr:MAG: chromate efflux transporter [Candidatus Latescibacterota bacterium]
MGTDSRNLRELAFVFLRLGATAFGGPAAHIGVLREEVVRRRGWLADAEFLDLLGAANLIPGPNSTELAIHIGRKRAGFPGLVVAGAAFILPAMAVTLAFAWAYVRFGTLPAAAGFLYGVKPVIIAIVAHALWGLGRVAIRGRTSAFVAIAALAAVAAGAHELAVLAAAGLLAAAIRAAPRLGSGTAALLPAALPALPAALVAGSAAAPSASVPFALQSLFLFFLKVGSVLYGSGYVLLAFLRADLVHRWGWLTEETLLDAVAVGQFTPGPLFTTATFIGYLLAGVPGAALATLGIFLPAFVFVAASAPLVPRIRRSPIAGAFLDGVNAASLALMAVVAWHLGRAAVVDVPAAALAVVAAIVLARYRLNSAWLVLAGAAIGLAIAAIRG